MLRTKFRAGYSVCLIVFALCFTTGVGAERAWPKWRGPAGDGHALDARAPTRWDPKSIAWKVMLPGVGQSSPVVWEDRIFLTAERGGGKERIVFCVNANDGKIVWQQTAWTGEPEKSHNMNGWASATCCTDGEVVVAFFGKGGLHAYSTDGKHLWSKDLGTFEGPWGTAACPLLVGNLVIQNGDSERNAFIEAFDRKTGDSVWRTKRPDNRGWSSPIVYSQGDNVEVVLNGHSGVTAYDPTAGKELWFTSNSNGRGEPTVTPGAGMLFVVCGLAGEMYGMRAENGTTPKIVWTASRRSGRDLGSPIVIGDYVLVTSLNGFATCYQASTGKELWKQRLEGQFSSSPIAIGNLALFQNEAGETFVIEPGPKLNIVSQNKLNPNSDEIFRASLTPVGDRVYSRSTKALYCIKAAKESAGQ